MSGLGGGQISVTFINLCFLSSQVGLKVSASDDYWENLDELTAVKAPSISMLICVGFFSKSQLKHLLEQWFSIWDAPGFTWAAFKKYAQAWAPFWVNWSAWGLGMSRISKLPADSNAWPGRRNPALQELFAPSPLHALTPLPDMVSF